MSESIKIYDLLLRQRGRYFGSIYSVVRCANMLAANGYTVYVAVTDLTIAEMKHVVYGYFYENMKGKVYVNEPDIPGASNIIFFNDYAIGRKGYQRTLRNVCTPEHPVVIIAPASTIAFLETNNALVKQPELAIVVSEWDGIIPKGSDEIMERVLDKSGITLETLTQKDAPSTVFMDLFEYGITLLTTGLLDDPDCRDTLRLASRIHDTLSNRPMMRLAEDIKIFMKHDVDNDILLIERVKL